MVDLHHKTGDEPVTASKPTYVGWERITREQMNAEVDLGYFQIVKAFARGMSGACRGIANPPRSWSRKVGHGSLSWRAQSPD